VAALINTIQINYYKQQCQRTQRTNQVYAYSEVRSVVSQPKCHQIELFSWILDDGRAPATGIRRVNLEPTDGNISPVSVRSALLKVAGYPGNFPVGKPGCPLVDRSCVRLQWFFNAGAGEVGVRLVPLECIKQLAVVVLDFGDLKARRGVGAMPPALHAQPYEHRVSRFFVNAFFPW